MALVTHLPNTIYRVVSSQASLALWKMPGVQRIQKQPAHSQPGLSAPDLRVPGREASRRVESSIPDVMRQSAAGRGYVRIAARASRAERRNRFAIAIISAAA